MIVCRRGLQVGRTFGLTSPKIIAGTKTQLRSVGSRSAARLMLDGYLSALILLHARFGGVLPPQIKGEEYFLKLVASSASATASSSIDKTPSSKAIDTTRT